MGLSDWVNKGMDAGARVQKVARDIKRTADEGAENLRNAPTLGEIVRDAVNRDEWKAKKAAEQAAKAEQSRSTDEAE